MELGALAGAVVARVSLLARAAALESLDGSASPLRIQARAARLAASPPAPPTPAGASAAAAARRHVAAALAPLAPRLAAGGAAALASLVAGPISPSEAAPEPAITATLEGDTPRLRLSTKLRSLLLGSDAEAAMGAAFDDLFYQELVDSDLGGAKKAAKIVGAGEVGAGAAAHKDAGGGADVRAAAVGSERKGGRPQREGKQQRREHEGRDARRPRASKGAGAEAVHKGWSGEGGADRKGKGSY